MALADDAPSDLNPAAWGSDHVGGGVPDYVTGDECLFCHRKDIGAKWSANRHQLSIRPAASEPAALEVLRATPAAAAMADEVRYVMGSGNRVRFLRRTPRYGELALHSVHYKPADGTPGKLLHTGEPHWDEQSFGRSCAGCHATGVDARSRAFSSLSIDCYACHGDVTLEHSNDSTQIVLAEARKDPPRVVVSICASCHIRGGRSRSTGLAYPNNFIPGDNVFRDLAVDFSDEHIQSLNPSDRHIAENVRDVVVNSQQDVTCLTCHNVHAGSSTKHRRVRRSDLCATCHRPIGPKSVRDPYEVHSRVCGY